MANEQLQTIKTNDGRTLRFVQGKRVDSEPEWWAAVALTRANLQFEFQSSYFGGSFIGGGVVVDFRVFTVPKPKLWEIDGEYFHGSATARERDKYQRFKLRSKTGLEVIATPARELIDLQTAETTVRRLFLG